MKCLVFNRLGWRAFVQSARFVNYFDSYDCEKRCTIWLLESLYAHLLLPGDAESKGVDQTCQGQFLHVSGLFLTPLPVLCAFQSAFAAFVVKQPALALEAAGVTGQ